jgi:hypothetical protein
MHTLYLLRAILILVALGACVGTGRSSRVFPDAKHAAENGLDSVHELGAGDTFRLSSFLFTDKVDPIKASDNDDMAKMLGFSSSEEAARSHLGVPLKIYNIRHDQIRQFQINGDVGKLMSASDTHSSIFPILVDGQIKSSLIATETDKGWKITRKGSAKLIRLIHSQNPKDTSFVVLIAPLNLRFVGEIDNGDLILTALRDYKSAKNTIGPMYTSFKAGDKISAAEFLAKLPNKEDPYSLEFTNGSVPARPSQKP